MTHKDSVEIGGKRMAIYTI